MKKHIVTIIKHPLISGSIIVVVGGLVSSAFNFLFNVFMSRNLSVADYGTLASLISMISLSMVVAGSAVPLIVKFSAEYIAKKQTDLLRGFVFQLTTYYFLAGIVSFLFFLLFPSQIGKFFNIHNNMLIVLAGVAIFFVYIGTVNAGVLQAKLSFTFLSIISFVGTLTKFLSGVLFVMTGLGVIGSVWAFLSSLIIPYFLSFLPLLFLFKDRIRGPKVNVKELFLYGGPSAVAMFGLTSFVTTDIILTKHFFSPHDAGIYAGLSLVGRVIFFLSAPIATVMFPLVVQRHAKKENYHNIFRLSLLLVLIPSIFLNMFYIFFPEFAINFFIKKKEYLQIANLIGLFGIYITIYSLISVFTNFFLSIKKTRINIPIIIVAFLQAGLIWLFHKNFLEIIFISLTIMSILFVLFIVYYFRLSKYDKTH